MQPGSGVLPGLRERQAGATESRVLARVEQIGNAQREERVALVAVLLDRRLVHGEHQHRVRIPSPHGERIGVEQESVTAFAVGKRGVATLDRFGHLVEGRRQRTDFIARPDARTMSLHAHGQGMRIVDERLHRPCDRGSEVHRHHDRHNQRSAKKQHATPAAVRYRPKQTHEQRRCRNEQRHAQQSRTKPRAPWYRRNVVLPGEGALGHALLPARLCAERLAVGRHGDGHSHRVKSLVDVYR